MQTRWALSYLRGPLTREQISSLMAPRRESPSLRPVRARCRPSSPRPLPRRSRIDSGSAPVLPAEIRQIYGEVTRAGDVTYRPGPAGDSPHALRRLQGRVDLWKNVARLCDVTDGVPDDPWRGATS